MSLTTCVKAALEGAEVLMCSPLCTVAAQQSWGRWLVRSLTSPTLQENWPRTGLTAEMCRPSAVQPPPHVADVYLCRTRRTLQSHTPLAAGVEMKCKCNHFMAPLKGHATRIRRCAISDSPYFQHFFIHPSEKLFLVILQGLTSELSKQVSRFFYDSEEPVWNSHHISEKVRIPAHAALSVL